MTQEDRIIQQARETDFFAKDVAPTTDEQPPAETQEAAEGSVDESAGDVEELRRQLQRERVEKGRIRKKDEEIASLKELAEKNDQTIAELRAEIERMRGVNEREKLVGGLDESIREGIDPDILNAAGEIAMRESARIRRENDDKIAALQKRLDELDSREKTAKEQNVRYSMNTSIENAYPGFLDRTDSGGADHDAWLAFLATKDPQTGYEYSRRLNSAYNNGAVEGVLSIIRDFMDDVGRGRSPASGVPAGALDSSSAGHGSDASRRYTQQDVERILGKASRDYYDHRISSEEYARIKREIDAALDEGRVD